MHSVYRACLSCVCLCVCAPLPFGFADRIVSLFIFFQIGSLNDSTIHRKNLLHEMKRKLIFMSMSFTLMCF